MYFQLLKKYVFDMQSLENIISDIEPNKQKNFGGNPYIGYDFVWNYMQQVYNIKIALFSLGI